MATLRLQERCMGQIWRHSPNHRRKIEILATRMVIIAIVVTIAVILAATIVKRKSRNNCSNNANDSENNSNSNNATSRNDPEVPCTQ